MNGCQPGLPGAHVIYDLRDRQTVSGSVQQGFQHAAKVCESFHLLLAELRSVLSGSRFVAWENLPFTRQHRQLQHFERRAYVVVFFFQLSVKEESCAEIPDHSRPNHCGIADAHECDCQRQRGPGCALQHIRRGQLSLGGTGRQICRSHVHELLFVLAHAYTCAWLDELARKSVDRLGPDAAAAASARDQNSSACPCSVRAASKRKCPVVLV